MQNRSNVWYNDDIKSTSLLANILGPLHFHYAKIHCFHLLDNECNLTRLKLSSLMLNHSRGALRLHDIDTIS